MKEDIDFPGEKIVKRFLSQRVLKEWLNEWDDVGQMRSSEKQQRWINQLDEV